MNLLKSFSSEVNKNDWWHSNSPVVVAVSAGVDSMTLLYLLNHLRRLRPNIIVAHVNHELRSASDHEEQYLKKYCLNHNLTLVVKHWPLKLHPDTGIENSARIFRYHFFQEVMDKYNAKVLLTAHHQNDQAETFLMKLIRGGSISQLIGIRSVRDFYHGKLIRPLLKYPKKDLKEFAINHHIKWYEDITNHSLKMTRNRMRHVLLPLMKKENPQILNHITNYTNQLEILIHINHDLMKNKMKQINITWNGKAGKWNLKLITCEPKYLQFEILRLIFNHYFKEKIISSRLINEIVNLINDLKKPQALIQGKDIIIKKSYNILKITGVNADLNDYLHSSFKISVNHWNQINQMRFAVFDTYHSSSQSGTRMTNFNLTHQDFPLIVRPWKYSDKIQLKNGGHQKVRRILIDEKVPNDKRKQALVLTTSSNFVLALLGYKESYNKPDRLNTNQYKFVLNLM